tara:strand:+ start:2230 stop:2601 length:372 start_codon:yes stop_codon:yes gene_type:complete
MAAIRVDGMEEVRRKLRRFDSEGEWKTELRLINKSAAEIVASDARRRAPVVSGALRRSTRALATQKRAYVAVGKMKVPYAPIILYGWKDRGIAANPFLHDAIDAKQGDIRREYTTKISKLLKK